MTSKKHLSLVFFLLCLLPLIPFSSALEYQKLSILDLDGDTLVGRKDPDGTKKYYHPDHLGSTDLVTNQTGAVVEETTSKI